MTEDLKQEQIKEKMRKLPTQKLEEAKKVLTEIKRLKEEEGKDESNAEIIVEYLKFANLLK